MTENEILRAALSNEHNARISAEARIETLEKQVKELEGKISRESPLLIDMLDRLGKLAVLIFNDPSQPIKNARPLIKSTHKEAKP